MQEIRSLRKLLPRLGDVIAIDIETSGLIPYEEQVLLIAIASKGNTYVAKAVDVDSEMPKFIRWINKNCRRVICHNAQFEQKFFWHHYNEMISGHILWDSMIADQNLYKGIAYQSNLAVVEQRYQIKRDYSKEHLQKSFIGMKPTDTFTKEQLEYAADDVVHLQTIATKQYKAVKAAGMLPAIKVEMYAMRSIVKMSTEGVRFDKEQHKIKVKEWQDEAYKLELEMDQLIRDNTDLKMAPRLRGIAKYDVVEVEEKPILVTNLFGDQETMPTPTGEGKKGHKRKKFKLELEVMYSSTPQLKKLFSKLGLPVPINSKEKTSFDAEAINDWIGAHDGHWACEFMEKLKKVKALTKLCTTYGLSMIKKLSPDGRMRSNYGQCFTATCRLNSSGLLNRSKAKEMKRYEVGVNMANIPPEARSVFIPDPDCVFIDSDMASQEVALAAANSKEPALIAAVMEDADLHSANATKVYGAIFGGEIPISKSKDPIEMYSAFKDETFTFIPKKLRDDTKALFFASFYGAGYKRASIVMKKYLLMFHPDKDHLKVSKKVVEAMKKRLPKLYGWLEALVALKDSQGYITADWTGRRKYFQGRAYGDVMNYPIQSSGATTIKVAMWKICRALEEKEKETGEYVGCILISVYDQVIVQAHKKYVKFVKELVEKEMADALTYSLKKLVPSMHGNADADVTRYWIKGYDEKALISEEEWSNY